MNLFFKKNTIWLISIISTLFLFASCNSSNSNEYVKYNGDFAFITTVNGVRCAATSYGYITSSEIQSLTSKNCYIVSYSFNKNDMTGNNIYTAESFTNVSGDPLTQTRLISAPPVNDDSLLVKTTSLAIPAYASSNYYGDRWAFSYTLSEGQIENPIVNFYYDANNQVDKDGKDISADNQIIIDVEIVKGTLGTGESAVKAGTVVGNFESLRTLYAAQIEAGATYTPVRIQFRYKVYNPDTSKYTVDYLESWNNQSQKTYYMMYF